MRRPSFFLQAVLLTLLGLVALRGLSFVVIDGLWFTSLGHQHAFTTMLAAQVGAFAFGALAMAAGVGGSAWWALRVTRNRPVVLSGDLRGSPLDAWLRMPGNLDRFVRLSTAVLALMGGTWTLSWWSYGLAFVYAQPFDAVDPILGYDASFYVHTLPVLALTRWVLMVSLLLGLTASVGVYAARQAFTITRMRDGQLRFRIDAAPRRHLGMAAAGVIAMSAAGFVVNRWAVMFSRGDGLFDGPGYTALHVMMPLLGAQAFLGLVVAGMVYQAVNQLRPRLIAGAILTAAAGWALGSVAPSTAQQLLVLPNELAYEAPYITHHVQATRAAWNLGDVEERALTGQAALDAGDIEANRVTIDAIRLWDHEPLLETFRQVQEIRTYYEFLRVDNDRYLIDGQLRQTMLSPREMLPSSLPDQARTWVNDRLVYTHGYGVALGPVNEVGDEGLPLLWVKDLPPDVSHPDPLRIDRPEIYFGEAVNDPVFVKTRAREFDYPSGEENAYSTYAGKAGLAVGGFSRRLMLALRFEDPNVLLSRELTSGSRALIHRHVVNRASTLAPFLWFDPDPTMSIVDGRLVWVVEGHTTTSRYPFSAHLRIQDGNRVMTTNYLRNSVKAVIDAYDGTVTLYRTNVPDPLLDTWEVAFPELFTPLEEMPEGLQAHLRYPLTLFAAQAQLFGTYHMTDSQVFYNREDEWQVPTLGDATVEPYYTIMKLPGEDREEFIAMLPFTPRDKDNLAAWMVARSDGDAYGGLRVYRFPKDRLVYGPVQVASRIQQNDGISEKLTLWNQQSSRAVLGTLLVIPVEESLLYIQPIYLQAEERAVAGGRVGETQSIAIPELKRVVVGYEDQIVMRDTLEGALAEVFGGLAPRGVEAAVEGVTLDGAELPQAVAPTAADAKARFEAAQEAAKAGDWATFGGELEALGRVIEAMQGEAPPEE